MSRHCKDTNILNVFDISIELVINPNDFYDTVRLQTQKILIII